MNPRAKNLTENSNHRETPKSVVQYSQGFEPRVKGASHKSVKESKPSSNRIEDFLNEELIKIDNDDTNSGSQKMAQLSLDRKRNGAQTKVNSSNQSEGKDQEQLKKQIEDMKNLLKKRKPENSSTAERIH